MNEKIQALIDKYNDDIEYINQLINTSKMYSMNDEWRANIKRLETRLESYKSVVEELNQLL